MLTIIELTRINIQNIIEIYQFTLIIYISIQITSIIIRIFFYNNFEY